MKAFLFSSLILWRGKAHVIGKEASKEQQPLFLRRAIPFLRRCLLLTSVSLDVGKSSCSPKEERGPVFTYSPKEGQAVRVIPFFPRRQRPESPLTSFWVVGSFAKKNLTQRGNMVGLGFEHTVQTIKVLKHERLMHIT